MLWIIIKAISPKEPRNTTSSRDDPYDAPVDFGPDGPKIISTGKPGRPRKKCNVMNAAQKEELEVPLACEDW